MSELLEDLPGSHSLASYDKLQHLDDENGNIEGEIERERDEVKVCERCGLWNALWACVQVECPRFYPH